MSLSSHVLPSHVLADLVPEAGGTPHARIAVSGVTADSRKVVPGSVFFALPGTKADGAAFIGQAIAAGAIAVVAEGPAKSIGDVPVFGSADIRRAFALAAARAFPRQPETIVAVTGTSGKSSVVDFVRQIGQRLGLAAASLGTLGIVTAQGSAYGSLTTPDALSLHRTLDDLASEGIDHLAMEASSHGIEQRRLDGVRLAAAGFTNLGRDHLDYHETAQAYAQAKLRLFDELLPAAGTAVVNADGPGAEMFVAAARKRGLALLTTGRAGETVRLVERQGDRLRLEAYGRRFDARFPLIGGFQVENALLAAGLVLATEGEGRAQAVFDAFADLVGVRGRLERVGVVNGAICIVDYAHKPDALAQVLDTLRAETAGQLVCVFGCGGDRDRGKRPLMGRIAVEKADIVIVTDDNPRSEDPAAIRGEIMAGAQGAREIGDRGLAIRIAVGELQPGDVLVVAGKGHETGQIVGDKTLPFSDHEEIEAAIAGRTA